MPQLLLRPLGSAQPNYPPRSDQSNRSLGTVPTPAVSSYDRFMARQHIVTSARQLGATAHHEQLRDGRPLLEHLDEVAILVREYGDAHQAVAYLQHVLETSAVAAETLEDQFGSLIARCVVLLTAPPGTEPKLRDRVVYAKLTDIAADDECAVALVVKTAERLADLQTCYLNEDRGKLRKFRRDHREFRAAVFRPGLAEGLWREIADIIAT